ncbi:hypothetical protein ABE427_12980 [Acinetobacter higginsii]|uniref:hypothetical protein n=1 Tax=Acinetobacter higginsii TaxID=70347 RepID=UPI00320A9AFE
MFDILFKFFGIDEQAHKFLIFFTNIFGLIFCFVLFGLCYKYSCSDFIYKCDSFLCLYSNRFYWDLFSSCNSASENFIIVIFGLLIGWFIAMLFSPYSEKDGAAFSIIFKGVSIFFSGYLVNELSKHPTYFEFFLNKQNLMLIFLFLSSILLSWLVVFSNRAYMKDNDIINKLNVEIKNYKAELEKITNNKIE